MTKYFEVEVTRTVTDSRKIYVSAENSEIAHDAAIEHAECEKVKARWSTPVTSYSTVKTIEIDEPARVDVAI